MKKMTGIKKLLGIVGLQNFKGLPNMDVGLLNLNF